MVCKYVENIIFLYLFTLPEIHFKGLAKMTLLVDPWIARYRRAFKVDLEVDDKRDELPVEAQELLLHRDELPLPVADTS